MNGISNSFQKSTYLCAIVTGSTLFGVCVVSGIVFEVLFSQYASLGFTIAWVGSGASLGIITLIVLGSFCWPSKGGQTSVFQQRQLPKLSFEVSDALDVRGEETLYVCTIPEEVSKDP